MVAVITPFGGDVTSASSHKPKTSIFESIDDAIIMSLDSSSNSSVETFLTIHSSYLIDNVGTSMLNALRALAPHQLAARVGDNNENLSYEMQDSNDGDIQSMILRGSRNKRNRVSSHIPDDSDNDDATKSLQLSPCLLDDIQSFEHSIQSALKSNHISYRGSYMRTLHTMPQPAHVDYDYPTLARHGKRLFLAFFPLTDEGAFLQLWHDPAKKFKKGWSVVEDEETKWISDDEDIDNARKNKEGESECANNGHASSCDGVELDGISISTKVIKGRIVYIPYGKMLIVPSDTIHGGGFKRGNSGNLRFHLYIAVSNDDVNDANVEKERDKRMELLQHPMNKYTERYDRSRELCERFVDSNGMEALLCHFFDD